MYALETYYVLVRLISVDVRLTESRPADDRRRAERSVQQGPRPDSDVLECPRISEST
ncbi:hypothetical protein OH77DRAFT_1432463 [Trametes cingulata]|nr:hypothetical protein OH77DRAFT_1432463 [Trametes cingulata]